MKIEYIKVKFNETYQYKYKGTIKCCDAMNSHNNQLFLSGMYEDNDSEDEYGRYVPKMCLYRSKTYRDWDGEYTNEYFYTINYCPFCGEKYEYEVVDEVDYDDIYAAAKKKREQLWKKHNRCDSIKMQSKLKHIVRRYDNFLNGFYEIGEFKKLTMEDVECLEE